MLLHILQFILPALAVFTTLFGVMARGEPRPGGVALFWRVGLVGLLLGGAAFYLVEKTPVLQGAGAWVSNAYRGLMAGAVLLIAIAALGSIMKRKPT